MNNNGENNKTLKPDDNEKKPMEEKTGNIDNQPENKDNKNDNKKDVKHTPKGVKKRGKSKKKLIIIAVILVILILAIIVKLGERQVGWAKTTSDFLHLESIPFMTTVADVLPTNAVCETLNIGSSAAASGETLQVYTASKRTIQRVLTGTGTLKPLDEYTVTALTSGEIVEDYFEEGDAVVEDQILMKIDSSNLETSLRRAQNSYDDAVEALDDLIDSKNDFLVKTDYSGVIQVMNYEVGDDVRQGEVIASVIDRDTMLIDIPFMQVDALNMHKGDVASVTVEGTFEELWGWVEKISPSYTVNQNGVKIVKVTIGVKNPGVITESIMATACVGDYYCTDSSHFYYNVNEMITAKASGEVTKIYKNEGDHVEKNDIILELDSESLDKSITKARRSVDDALKALEDAQDAFDNYEITAPISGTVVDKKYKKGEKIGSAGGSTVAVIYDLSALVFEMNIDELDIDSVKIGQSVKVTSDAKTGMTYVGEITKTSVQGVTTNGTTYYSITVTINDYGQDTENALRPGMNIDAEIIIEQRENVIAIPVDAISRGNKVTVVSSIQNENHGEKTDVSAVPEKNANDNGSEMPVKNTDEQRQNGRNNRQNGSFGGYSTVPGTTETKEVVVETGVSDEDYIEIISGLNEGDMVVIKTVTAPSSNNADMGMFGMSGGMGGMPGGMGGMPLGAGGARSSGMSGARPGM